MNYNYVVSLRADASGIKDCSGNTWQMNDMSFGEGKFSAKSMIFNGSTSYLYNSVINAKMLANEPFTISFWAKWQTVPWNSYTGVVISPNEYSYSGANQIIFNREDNTFRSQSSSDNSFVAADISGLTVKIWHHFAITRDANNICRIFVNGVLASSVTNSEEFNFSRYGLVIGKIMNNTSTDDNNSQDYMGELDDLCIIKDTAVWTASFTPPTSYLWNTQTLYVSDRGGGIQRKLNTLASEVKTT